jgi:hypothetical protein
MLKDLLFKFKLLLIQAWLNHLVHSQLIKHLKPTNWKKDAAAWL